MSMTCARMATHMSVRRTTGPDRVAFATSTATWRWWSWRRGCWMNPIASWKRSCGSFLSLTSARLLGGNVRVVGKSGTATWPAADATGKLWNLVEGFKRDECDLAFAALFSEMEALRARATGPRFHTIVLWKCDLSPDSVPETAGSPEPPGAASMSLFWLSDPEYPRSIIPARFTRWFGKSITSVGTEVQGLSNSLVNVASRYPLR